MKVNLPLKEMTLHEKLVVMETLWEDLARSPEAVEAPAWHNDVLDKRRRRIANGKSRFSDWETAKVVIRKKLS